jgi:hypothetical protein
MKNVITMCRGFLVTLRLLCNNLGFRVLELGLGFKVFVVTFKVVMGGNKI